MKTTMDANGFEAAATAEERALARALEACPMPPMPAGTVEGIERRARALRAASRARALRALWMSAAAAAAAVALWFGTWRTGPEGAAPVASAESAESAEAEDPFAEAEAEWLSPYDAEFEELETTLLAFEALDFDSDATAFPSL